MAYQPASNMTSTATLRHLATVYYKREALDTLTKELRYQSVCESDSMPKRNGLTVQWYRPTLPAANTTPSSEGTVGTGLAYETNTLSATLSQYSDFYSMSTLLVDTSISDEVSQVNKMASYRAALTVDTLGRTEFNSTASVDITTLGGAPTIGDFRRANTLLEGIDVRRGPNGRDEKVAIIHPYVKYDLKSDNTAGGWVDVIKYARPMQLISGEVGMIDNIRFVETTNVVTSGSAPNVIYECPVVGKGAVGCVDLVGSEASKVTDPAKQSFNTRVIYTQPSGSDPEGNINAYVAYRFVQVFKILDSTNYRFRTVLCDVSWT